MFHKKKVRDYFAEGAHKRSYDWFYVRLSVKLYSPETFRNPCLSNEITEKQSPE